MTLSKTKVSLHVSFVLQSSDKLGLSLELGSFVAGVMISTTDFAEHTLKQVDAALVGVFFVIILINSYECFICYLLILHVMPFYQHFFSYVDWNHLIPSFEYDKFYAEIKFKKTW